MRFERNKTLVTMIEEIEFLEHSYDGGKNYIEHVMTKHPKEDQKNFERRKERAVYINYCQSIADLYNQYVFREKITRDVTGIDVELYMDDADYMYSEHKDFMRIVSKIGSVKGLCGIIVDKPQGKWATKADELAEGVHEYCSIYEPDHIYDFTIERIKGRPTLVRLVLSEGEDMFKVWTPDGWTLYEQKGRSEANKLDDGVNSLKRIPFVLHRNRRTLDVKWFAGESDIKSIAQANRVVFYRDCQADEIMDGTAFAMLSGDARALGSQQGGQTGGDVDVGTSTFLHREQDSPEYKYVEPAHSSLDKILTWRATGVEEIGRLSRLNTSQGVKSGDALEIEFQDLNAILSEKAEMLEATETKIFMLIGLWQGKEAEVNITYPRRFGVRDLSRDIDNMIKAKTLVTTPIFAKMSAEQIARRVLADSNDDEVQLMADEINAATITVDNLNA